MKSVLKRKYFHSLSLQISLCQPLHLMLEIQSQLLFNIKKKNVQTMNSERGNRWKEKCKTSYFSPNAPISNDISVPEAACSSIYQHLPLTLLYQAILTQIQKEIYVKYFFQIGPHLTGTYWLHSGPREDQAFIQTPISMLYKYICLCQKANFTHIHTEKTIWLENCPLFPKIMGSLCCLKPYVCEF